VRTKVYLIYYFFQIVCLLSMLTVLPYPTLLQSQNDVRTYRLTRAEKMAQMFDAEFTGELRPRYNIAPTQQVPVVRATDSGRVISSMRWGLIPSWATAGWALQPYCFSEGDFAGKLGEDRADVTSNCAWANYRTTDK
jgi:putative SOS response-associated peptidase YedK